MHPFRTVSIFHHFCVRWKFETVTVQSLETLFITSWFPIIVFLFKNPKKLFCFHNYDDNFHLFSKQVLILHFYPNPTLITLSETPAATPLCPLSAKHLSNNQKMSYECSLRNGKFSYDFSKKLVEIVCRTSFPHQFPFVLYVYKCKVQLGGLDEPRHK